MGLDIRLPIGLLFSLVGSLLVGFGVFSESAIYHRSLDLNLNLARRAVLLVFGTVMAILGRGRAFRPHAAPSAEGTRHSADERPGCLVV